ncbi:MAG: trimethylamine methyltransferase family protein [Firmicutes bacterium]|nr:trimethylamine methyltransferase family protein [Bacillota bacterium]
MNYGKFSSLYTPLSNNEIESIHVASMNVLENTGFKLDNQRALKLFHEKGAIVDFNNNIVRATEQWIMEYLKKAPARVVLYGIDQKNTMVVEANRVFFGTGGTALNIHDWQTGQRRPTVTEDIGEIARLVDALPNIDWYCLPVYPNDRTKQEADVVRFYHGLKNTGKHVMGGIYGNKNGVKDLIKLVQMIAGGKEELRKKPIVSVICSTISPLKLETHYVDFIFDLVEAGIPVATSCAPIAGATSPITLAGTIVQVNAEAICGILITQVINEGAPVLYSTVPTTADMRTMDFLFGPVENGIMNAACAQMASFYNLPMYSTGGVTESKLFDVQNGAEKCMNNLLPAMAGAQLIHNAAGLIDSSMTVVLEQYVLDDEILGMVRRVIDGIRINTETLAVDEISAVGPGGNYLASEHTVRNMRNELFMPKTAVRANYAAWVRDGSLGSVAQARLIAEKVLDNNRTKYLPDTVEAEIAEHFPELRINKKIT